MKAKNRKSNAPFRPGLPGALFGNYSATAGAKRYVVKPRRPKGHNPQHPAAVAAEARRKARAARRAASAPPPPAGTPAGVVAARERNAERSRLARIRRYEEQTGRIVDNVR